jgi:hypothetical protein
VALSDARALVHGKARAAAYPHTYLYSRGHETFIAGLRTGNTTCTPPPSVFKLRVHRASYHVEAGGGPGLPHARTHGN